MQGGLGGWNNSQKSDSTLVYIALISLSLDTRFDPTPRFRQPIGYEGIRIYRKQERNDLVGDSQIPQYPRRG